MAGNINSIVDKFPNWPDPDDHWSDIPVESLEKWKQWGQKSTADSSSSTGVYKRKVDSYIHQTPSTSTPIRTSGFYRTFQAPSNSNYDANTNYRPYSRYSSSTQIPYRRQNNDFQSVTTKQPLKYQSGFFPSGLLMEFPNSPTVSHPDPEEEYNPLHFPTDNFVQNEFQSFPNGDVVVPLNPPSHHFQPKFHNKNHPHINEYRSSIQPKPFQIVNTNFNVPTYQRSSPSVPQANENMVSLERTSQEDISDPYLIKPFVNFNIPVNVHQGVPKEQASSPHPYPFEPNQNIEQPTRNVKVTQQQFKPKHVGNPLNQPLPREKSLGISKRPRRNFQPPRRPPMNRINLDFGFRPPFVIGAQARPVRPVGNRQRGLSLPIPDHFEGKQFEQSSDAESIEHSEENFYDDKFFEDPDFDNFDFSDFEEFEVYAEEADRNSTDKLGEETNNYNSKDGNEQKTAKLDEKQHESYEYNRDGLEMYKRRQKEVEDEQKRPTESRQSFQPDVNEGEKLPFLEPDREKLDYDNRPTNMDPFKQFSYEPSNDHDFEEFDKYFNDFRGKVDQENPRIELQNTYNHKEVSDNELALNVITDPFDTSDLRLNEKVI